ncbi:MAG: hypothetical protein ACYC8T_10145 [Myxococcaceae bacterium]
MTLQAHRSHPSHRALLAALAGFLAVSCAQERPPIVRVQPNYFEKSFFIGKDFQGTSDDPEFYSLGTLVDVGYGAGQDGLFTSTYAQPLTRIKWTVQENLLIARLAYERINGSDGKGLGKATNDGIVVAAYPIESHFDIQRNYNPATGEQTNVLDENTTDRPWFQRDFMRVDWSKNQSTDNYDYDTLAQVGIYGGVTYEPLTYYVNDPADENAPHFDEAEGYLDVTNKAWATPQMVDISQLGWGISVIPACWLDADFGGGVAPATGCSPVELTIRQAFYKVKADDYEPADWDGNRFKSFGAFTTERKGYARDYGMTDTNWYRFINRYEIWNRSHFYADSANMSGHVPCFTPKTTPTGLDPHRDLNKDGTEDECAEVGRGSRCDTFRQACTLPFRDRQQVTIPWYYSNGGPSEYFEPTAAATHEWDVALRSAVMTSRYAECAHTGGTTCASEYPVYFGQQDENTDAVELSTEVDACRMGKAYQGQDCDAVANQVAQARGYSAGVLALAKMSPMIVLCHSPVEFNDHPACGAERLPVEVSSGMCALARENGDKALLATCNAAINARRGDLRYHMVNAIANPQTPSPWGIMVDSNDPLSGKVVSASINVWTHVNDLWSQGIVDTARYIKGELSTADVTEGTYVRDWAQAAEAASGAGAVSVVSREDFDSQIADFTKVSVEDLRQIRTQPAFKTPALQLALKKMDRDMDFVRADAQAPSTMRPVYEARRKKAVGSATEAALTTKMMQSFAGVNGMPNSEAVMSLASPLRGANPALLRDVQNRHQLALAERGACVLNEAPAPFAIVDLAGFLEEKFGTFDKKQDRATQMARGEKMRMYLAQKAHFSVITHEMGHSIGLRHNFVSSSDAFNYRAQYWQLRTDNGQNQVACTQLTADGSCVGPRYFDPLTANERKNLIQMFMQSSTMDYAGEATQDMLGLGAYDFAATRMFYGDVTAVFGDSSYMLGQPRGLGVLEKQDNFGGILGFRPTIGGPQGSQRIHYSQLQKEFELISGCKDIDPNAFRPGAWNEALNGKWSPVLDGLLVQVDGKYSRCRQQPVDYVRWDQLRNAVGNEPGAGNSHALDIDKRVRVPYGFATDRWADLGNLSVYRHDNGADAYELFDFLITQQEVNHIFDNYRRGRSTFSVRGASQRTLGRYNEKLRDAAKGLGLMVNVYKDFAVEQGYDFDSLWPYIADESFAENILASGIGFDHFAKQMARPQYGPHFMGSQGGSKVVLSAMDTAGNAGTTVINIPNGGTGYFGNVGVGGRPLENALAEDKGEYDSEYTVNAGSYYDKAWTAMLMTESVDNFISASRRDYLDGRYRSVSVADVFPEGYRRWLANNLTGDEVIKGSRLATNATGGLLVDEARYPANGIGWTTWWRASPQSCFLGASNLLCETAPAQSVALESQVGWEQQKFLIAFTLQYLPENQKQQWLNSMSIWEIGADTDPGFINRIEFHDPAGKTYVANTFGRETIFGKSVEKGVGARILEYANDLLVRAYETDPGPDANNDDKADWYIPKSFNGQPRVKFDPTIQVVTATGGLQTGRPGCNATDNSTCTCASNRACIELSSYTEVPYFMRQAMRDYGLAHPSMKGIY